MLEILEYEQDMKLIFGIRSTYLMLHSMLVLSALQQERTL